MSALLAALRLSRRGIGRARARSALIMVLVGLPVMLLTAGLTWQATVDVDAKEGLARTLGAADVRVDGPAFGVPIRQSADGTRSYPRAENDGAARDRALTEREVLSFFGPGGRALPWQLSWTGYRTAAGAYREADLWEIDLRDPITTGMYGLSAGRLPRTPREVAASPALGLRPGTAVTLNGGIAATVVGIVERRRDPDSPMIATLPGTVRGAAERIRTHWLVDTPAPVTWQRVAELNRQGVVVVSRAVVEDPPSGNGPADPLPSMEWSDTDLLMIALAATIVVLEVVFLAGPAFAVGIRRRRRELALIAAQGGSPRHLRGVVLAEGLTLGLAAGVLGAAGGIGLAAAFLPFFRHGPFEVPAGRIALAVLLGVVSALLAAVVPAIQASRAEPVEALAGRRTRVRDRRGLPVLGVLLLAGAVAVIVARTVPEVWVPRWLSYKGSLSVNLLVSVVLGQLGMVLLTPWLVGVAARSAGRLPLPFRMAARDAARNRGRTAPAVTAVLAATAVFAAMAVMVASASARARENYSPFNVTGTTVVSFTPPRSEAAQEIRSELRRTVASLLPGVPMIEMGRIAGPASQQVHLVVQTSCRRGCLPVEHYRLGRLPVGGADLLRHLLRGPDPVAEAALAEGKAVVFDPQVLRGGKLTFTTDLGRTVEHSVPAVVRRPPAEPVVWAMLPPSRVAGLGLTVAYDTLLADPAVLRTTPEQERRLHEAVRAVTPSAYATVERGFQDEDRATLLALGVLCATILVLGGTFAATGLAAAESRPDRATLAAVGAPARVQRLLVAGQAGFIAVLGVATGIPAGLAAGAMTVIAFGVPRGGGMSGAAVDLGTGIVMYVLDVPWLLLGGVLVGLPLLAALVAGACARTGVVFARRLT